MKFNKIIVLYREISWNSAKFRCKNSAKFYQENNFAKFHTYKIQHVFGTSNYVFVQK